jgi:hypothetical protein
VATRDRQTGPSWGERTLVVLVGVVLGYVVGGELERAHGWTNARAVAMPLGGILTAIAARLTLARFAPRPPGDRPR